MSVRNLGFKITKRTKKYKYYDFFTIDEKDKSTKVCSVKVLNKPFFIKR